MSETLLHPGQQVTLRCQEGVWVVAERLSHYGTPGQWHYRVTRAGVAYVVEADNVLTVAPERQFAVGQTVFVNHLRRAKVLQKIAIDEGRFEYLVEIPRRTVKGHFTFTGIHRLGPHALSLPGEVPPRTAERDARRPPRTS
ncbi:hypothetical protein BH23GEM7_BH23GEM7_05140 [soil metagenome]